MAETASPEMVAGHVACPPTEVGAGSVLVESPGGLSPPGAPRTVHDPLESHGSRCSPVARFIDRLLASWRTRVQVEADHGRAISKMPLSSCCSSMVVSCRWRSRPQHQLRTSSLRLPTTSFFLNDTGTT